MFVKNLAKSSEHSMVKEAALYTLASIAEENVATFSMVLSKYHVVSKLLALLLHESLDSGEKLSIVLAIGHCTEDCGENSFDENEADQLKDIYEKENLEEQWKAANEILCRIKQCEREGKEEKLQSGQYKDDTSSMKIKIQNNLKHLCADSIGDTKVENKDTNQSRQLPSYKSNPFTLCSDIIDKEVGFQATDNCFKMLNYRCS
ncbi:hypothetical protein A6R68_12805, partial [Neotoma lepida]